jgi:hypothetical protein
MYKKLTWVVLLGAAIGLAVLYTANAGATPAMGFVSTTVAMGRFDEIDVFNQLDRRPEGSTATMLLAVAETKGSDSTCRQRLAAGRNLPAHAPWP